MMLFTLSFLIDRLFILTSSLINNLTNFNICSVIGSAKFCVSFIPLTWTLGALSIIRFASCDLTSTVNFLDASTTNSDFQGVKYVSSAITSSFISPFVLPSSKPFSFLIGIIHLPSGVICPLNKRLISSDSIINRAWLFLY